LSTTESAGTNGSERDIAAPLRAIVVDDHGPIRDLIVVNLELEGFEVRSARDGQEGLEMALAWRPDVITLDLMMPRLDGFDTLERLRADPVTAHIPVVFVTARISADDRKRAERLGVDAYITKPFEPAELVSVVTSLARNGRSLA
jgi:CheY-like chemotaxis protein